jgi:hypothetical protein
MDQPAAPPTRGEAEADAPHLAEAGGAAEASIAPAGHIEEGLGDGGSGAAAASAPDHQALDPLAAAPGTAPDAAEEAAVPNGTNEAAAAAPAGEAAAASAGAAAPSADAAMPAAPAAGGKRTAEAAGLGDGGGAADGDAVALRPAKALRCEGAPPVIVWFDPFDGVAEGWGRHMGSMHAASHAGCEPVLAGWRWRAAAGALPWRAPPPLAARQALGCS